MTRRALIPFLALAFVLAACGGGSKRAAPSTTKTTKPPSTTTTTAPTTTAPPPPPVAPLTGLPPSSPAILQRPALVIKVDNGNPHARPQQGINQADIVYEEMVEGSVSRFAVVFQSQDAQNRVIPVRSARTTDISLFTPLNHPLFAWSGANADFAPLIRRSAIVDVGYDAQSSRYHRERSRKAPSNLWTTTQDLWALTPAGAQPPPPMFQYRAANEPLPPEAKPLAHAYVAFGSGGGSAPVDWDWNAGAGGWARRQKGTPQVDETGRQFAPQNVIIQVCQYHDTGHVDVSGATVYEADTVGSGEAWVLTAGAVIHAHWAKPDINSVTTYTSDSGQPVKLTPGQTWVQLPWAGHATVNIG